MSHRPTLQHYLDAHPHDPRTALTLYRAARAEWQSERALDIEPASRIPWRLLAVGACIVTAALLLMRALAGCSAPAPAPAPAPGDCAADCHAGEPEGSRALLDCVAACSSPDDFSVCVRKCMALDEPLPASECIRICEHHLDRGGEQ